MRSSFFDFDTLWKNWKFCSILFYAFLDDFWGFQFIIYLVTLLFVLKSQLSFILLPHWNSTKSKHDSSSRPVKISAIKIKTNRHQKFANKLDAKFKSVNIFDILRRAKKLNIWRQIKLVRNPTLVMLTKSKRHFITKRWREQLFNHGRITYKSWTLSYCQKYFKRLGSQKPS